MNNHRKHECTSASNCSFEKRQLKKRENLFLCNPAKNHNKHAFIPSPLLFPFLVDTRCFAKHWKQSFKVHGSSANSWTNGRFSCVALSSFFCELSFSHHFQSMMRRNRIQKPGKKGNENVLLHVLPKEEFHSWRDIKKIFSLALAVSSRRFSCFFPFRCCYSCYFSPSLLPSMAYVTNYVTVSLVVSR